MLQWNIGFILSKWSNSKVVTGKLTNELCVYRHFSLTLCMWNLAKENSRTVEILVILRSTGKYDDTMQTQS